LAKKRLAENFIEGRGGRMINETDTAPAVKPCVICGGSGELVQIDEEVGCRISLPCWSCQTATAAPDKEIDR
jgi:hypothetical protein